MYYKLLMFVGQIWNEEEEEEGKNKIKQ